jgi:signal transduction histidine kinase
MNTPEPSWFQQAGVRGNITLMIFAALAAILVLLPPALSGQPSMALTNLGQVQHFPLEKAKEARPVNVQATVTFCDPEWRMLFVQDDTGSVYVGRSLPSENPSWNLKLGQLVQLDGVTTRGVIQCNIGEKNLQVIGQGKLPVPLQVNSDVSFKQAGDARLVRTVGFIPGVSAQGNKFVFDLQVRPDKTLKSFVMNTDAASVETLAGKMVEATGVLGLNLDSNQRPTGKNDLWVMELSQIKIIRPLPMTSIGYLTTSQVNQWSNSPVHIRGNIRSQRAGKFFVVGDDSGSVQVNCEASVSADDGNSVEVFGYPEKQGDAFVLNHATVEMPGSVTDAQNASAKVVIPDVANTNLSELTQVVQVRTLPVSEAVRGYPVRITGVLTYNDPASSTQFIQDDSGGIFVDLKRKKFDALPEVGQMVEILGFSGPGDYAPVIEAEQMRVLGTSVFPRPKITMIQALMTGSEDSQWVTLNGVIHSQSVEGSNTVLTLSTGDAMVDVTVPDTAKQAAPKNYVDSLAEIQGVCATIFDDQRRLRGIRLYVPNWDQVRVDEAAPEDAFALPLRPISQLSQFHAGTGGLHRSRVLGVALLRLSDGSFYVQDATGGVLVQARKPAPMVAAGDAVELAGFPSVKNGLPVLQEATIKPPVKGKSPAPVLLSADLPLNESLNGTLVQLQGRVLGHSATTVQEILTVQFGQWITDAVLEKEKAPDQLDGVTPGSVISLTGVYAARLDDNHKIQSFQLLLRSPRDIVLISRPSFWTARHTVWAFGTLGTVVALALVWVRLLRKQVRQQTRKLREEIDERKRMEGQVEKTHKELVMASRKAGMAEVATSVLHNVGNVLNSVNVSANLVAEQIQRSRSGKMDRVVAMLEEHTTDLGDFLTRDIKGRQLPVYIVELAKDLEREQELVVRELGSLTKNIDHIKDIVSMQQSYATAIGFTEMIKITDLVEDALRMNAGALERHQVQLVREYDSALPEISVDKHKVLQILINLVRNAKYACDESGRTDKRIIVLVSKAGARLQISVIDNGVGILRENLTRIFNYGFTTRKHGHGFGLHSGALAAKELGGTLVAQSDGPGTGATFTLELPVQPNGVTSQAPAAEMIVA